MAAETTTYYEILQVSQDCSEKDIKKAYRRLALLHHPDRNPPEQKEQATKLFRQVNEAYEVLSDPDQRQFYDQELRQGRASSFNQQQQQQRHHDPYQHAFFHRNHRDPFAQFNDLFQNDPFFQEAFKDMDDLFAKRFQQQNSQDPNNSRQMQQPPSPAKRGWGQWIADCLGIQFQVSTSSTFVGSDGRAQTTSTSSTTYGGGRNNNNHHHHRSTYTSKSTRTIVENGQRVTIQSLEKDGNKIEEKYVNNELVERLVNGRPEPIQRIGAGQRRDDGDL